MDTLSKILKIGSVGSRISQLYSIWGICGLEQVMLSYELWEETREPENWIEFLNSIEDLEIEGDRWNYHE
jgi:hypothetical protein